MTLFRLTLGALALTFGTSIAARADDMPFTPGNYTEVTGIAIDDGHFYEYMKFLDTEAKAEDDYAKSQGWLVEMRVLANVHKRANEPDVYLLRTFKSVPDAAEQLRRTKLFEEHFKMSEQQAEAGSGARAKYRKVTDTMLLQELILK